MEHGVQIGLNGETGKIFHLTNATPPPVILEADLTYTDQASGARRQTFWRGNFTVHNGCVTSDRSYINPAEWPGVQQMAGYLGSRVSAG